MNRHAAKAIVLDVRERGESDRGVLLLTEDGELVGTHAPAGARSRRRFGGALQPGALVDARWVLRREGAEARLEEAQLREEPPPPDPLERYYGAAHLLELARAFAREGEEDPAFFRLFAALLERLAAGDPVVPLLRYAEAWTLRLAGLLPEWDACAECGEELGVRERQLAPGAGVFCAAHRPAGARAVPVTVAAWIENTRGAAPANPPALPESLEALLERTLGGLITAFTERPLRALDAWRTVRQKERGQR